MFKNASKQEVWAGVVIFGFVGSIMLTGYFKVFRISSTIISLAFGLLTFAEWSAVYQSIIYKNEKHDFSNRLTYAIMYTIGFSAFVIFTVACWIKGW